MSAAPRQITLPMARLLAETHADIGLAQFNDLQRVKHEAKSQGQPLSFVDLVRRGVPAALSLSLALELELKVLHYQHFEKYPQTHDLLKICAALEATTVAAMERRYDELFSRPLPLEVVHLGITAVGNAEAFPETELPDVSTFHAALRHVAGAYVLWRYVYEEFEAPQEIGLHFKALLCLVETVHDSIVSFKGNAKVTLG
jgi:hypothetical protein